MEPIKKELDRIGQLSDQKERVSAYSALLEKILKPESASLDILDLFLTELVNEYVPLVISRQVVLAYAKGIGTLPVDLHKQVADMSLGRIQARAVSFEDQVSIIREDLGKVFEKEEEWIDAARTLGGIPLESGVRRLSDEYKATIYLKIAQLYLEVDEYVSAEANVNRVSVLNFDVPDLQLKYRVCFARILDYKRKFLEAAQRYYGLSHDLPEANDADTSLTFAIICSLLAPAGPRRSRMLATLYKDERVASNNLYNILESMYLEKILQIEEVEVFAKMVKPHQMALLSDGSTVLDRAVIEHNVLAASRLYRAITFTELGRLLGIDAVKAEKIACGMVVDDRLQATVDQVKGLMHFHESNTVDDSVVGGQEATHDDLGMNAQLSQWDKHIEEICSTVSSVADVIIEKYPQLGKQ